MAGKRIIRSRTNFIRWLERLPRGTRFTASDMECPLARYSGESVGWVTYGGASERGGDLPPWAVLFVARFLGNGIAPNLLTRGRALRVMRRLM